MIHFIYNNVQYRCVESILRVILLGTSERTAVFTLSVGTNKDLELKLK